MLDDGCEAIEIRTPSRDYYEKYEGLLKLLKQFKYRSVHTNDIVSPAFNEEDLNYYKEPVSVLDLNAITLHPHTMRKWSWLSEYFGNKASFEQ